MAIFAWTPDLTTENDFIDDQHKQLFAAADELFASCQIGREKQEAEVKKTIQFLLDYTIKHFADEEELQKKYAYPDYPAHKQTHDEFRDTVRELAEKLPQSGSMDEFIIGVYTTIGEWLIDHIRGQDAKLGAHIRAFRA